MDWTLKHPRRERPYCDLEHYDDHCGQPRFKVRTYETDNPGYGDACDRPRGAVKALRDAARKFVGTECAYKIRCRGSAPKTYQITVDHVIPRDGTTMQHDLANLVIACDACNSDKKNLVLEKWAASRRTDA